ncbi:MAG: HAMP domain-containing methyl-accepting chemotaxis protein [Paraglaciecola sp.]|uniref:methyl-accepting chemotaxis protein n=1 Tax=Paraglaciecola sp. TaxID=1920173 RepID=UPI003299B574
MLKRINIRSKIYLLGFTLLALMLIIGGIALVQMDKIGKELVDIAEENIPLTGKVTKITENQLEQSILFERAIFNASLVKQNIPGSLAHFDQLKSQWAELTIIIEQDIKDTEVFVTKAIDVIHSEKGKAEFRHVLSVLTDVEHRYKESTLSSEKILSKAGTHNLIDIAKDAAEMEKLQDALKHELIDLLDEIQKFTLAASIKAEQDEQSGIVLITIAFVVSLTLGIVFPLVISRSIVVPLNNLTSRLAEIASGDGDLTVLLDDNANDETGDVAREFNKFLAVLRTLIINTTNQANELEKATELALTNMQKTATNVNKQQAETEMVATAVNEMSSSALEVARSASNASQVTQEVKDKVTEGRQEALDTQKIINQLSEEVSEASQVIESLVEETNSIGNVLESIQGIAAQTNLLALNAAIEAARAGETGRGFAVVADEVRTLAQRTQTSTVDIQDLLVRLKAEANNAVTSMNKGTDSAAICLEKSAKTSQTFEEASTSVTQISDLNIQIAAAAEQQSQVVEEINVNIVRINDLASVTSKGAKTTSEANTTIAKRVVDLQTNLNAFIV